VTEDGQDRRHGGSHALSRGGTFMRPYPANRRAAVEDLIEADPVATRVRQIMVDPQDVEGECVRPSPRRSQSAWSWHLACRSILEN
jgi:hypothetical protein